MQTQTTKTGIARQLSARELYHYFFPLIYPVWARIAFAGGAILFVLVGLSLRLWLIFCLGLLVGLAGLLVYWRIKRANPDDDHYDTWVKSQAKYLYKRGLQTLGINEAQLTDHPLWIRSYVLPGSQAAADYDPATIRIQCGKDGTYRTSINVFTFIYPMARSFAIFKSDINAFRPSFHNDEDEFFPYRHIVAATTIRTQETLLLGERKYPYLVEQFCLKLSNGESIPLSAAVRIKPPGSVAGVPTLTLPNTHFSWTLNKLREIIQ